MGAAGEGVTVAGCEGVMGAAACEGVTLVVAAADFTRASRTFLAEVVGITNILLGGITFGTKPLAMATLLASAAFS